MLLKTESFNSKRISANTDRRLQVLLPPGVVSREIRPRLEWEILEVAHSWHSVEMFLIKIFV